MRRREGAKSVTVVTLDDFRDFDYIFAMDNANLNDLKDLAPKGSKAEVELFGKYKFKGQTTIRDPYKVTLDDFRDFDYIFAMDNANLNDLKDLAPKGSKAKVVLLGKYDPEGQTIIRDPYYDSGSQGFEEVYAQCLRCCNAFFDQLSS
ncbi:hypothetical protein HPB47_028465 [Ixodes persulcatus]|uniref:Uncharacterized protein n=1 Tax=Ixodes persulcatus TaxID=34615 RepID=A0AC60PUP8_IXOPE|nr:hypothetical protein HPB47_028465 [Ixodes persulcatus]